MTDKRLIEVFTSGCPLCEGVVSEVSQAACPSCEVVALRMEHPGVAERARELGVRTVPAVAIDGILARCCARTGTDLDVLRQAGLGQPL